MKALKAKIALYVTLGLSSVASASSLDTIGSLGQAQFLDLATELGAATHYRSVSPPEALGLLGLDVGLGVSGTDISGDLFDLASAGDFDGSDLIAARIHVQKGLPFGLNAGASIAAIPDTDATIIGGELRFTVVDGGVVTPSVGIRASYSQLLGVDDLDLSNSAVELGISKGFLMLTPYAGVGYVRSVADPQNIDELTSETIEENKYFLGVTLNFGVALTLEADRTGDIRTYSAKTGFRF